MKNTIIAVFGVSDQGKTESIRALLRRLMLNNPNEPISVDQSPINLEVNTPDIFVTIQVGDSLVGITSQGDPKTGLKSRLWKLVKLNCAVIICSTRTKGNTVWDVEDVEKKSDYNAIWVSNFKGGEIYDQNALNVLSGQSIDLVIRDIIEGRL